MRTICSVGSGSGLVGVQSFAAAAAAMTADHRAERGGLVTTCRRVIPSVTAKPAANELTSAAAAPANAKRRDDRTGEPRWWFSPTDLDIGERAVAGMSAAAAGGA